MLLGLGLCLAVMNTSFYLALERLPISLVAAVESVGTVGVALYGLRTLRNLGALGSQPPHQIASLGDSLATTERAGSQSQDARTRCRAGP